MLGGRQYTAHCPPAVLVGVARTAGHDATATQVRAVSVVATVRRTRPPVPAGALTAGRATITVARINKVWADGGTKVIRVTGASPVNSRPAIIRLIGLKEIIPFSIIARLTAGGEMPGTSARTFTWTNGGTCATR